MNKFKNGYYLFSGATSVSMNKYFRPILWIINLFRVFSFALMLTFFYFPIFIALQRLKVNKMLFIFSSQCVTLSIKKVWGSRNKCACARAQNRRHSLCGTCVKYWSNKRINILTTLLIKIQPQDKLIDNDVKDVDWYQTFCLLHTTWTQTSTKNSMNKVHEWMDVSTTYDQRSSVQPKFPSYNFSKGLDKLIGELS